MSGPETALDQLAAQLREEETVISAHVRDPGGERPVLGMLAAAGPRAAEAPTDYALVVESVREGYLLHYGEARIVAAADRDLDLLTGDYMYALGLERLGDLGDLHAVRELSDLITLAAQVHDDGPRGEPEAAKALWLACVTAIAAGPSEAHQRAKGTLAARDPEAARALLAAAQESAALAGIGDDLSVASRSIDFRPSFTTP